MKELFHREDFSMNETRESIYDEICRVLTDYEEGLVSGDTLYEMLLKIANRWEDTITVQE